MYDKYKNKSNGDFDSDTESSKTSSSSSSSSSSSKSKSSNSESSESDNETNFDPDEIEEKITEKAGKSDTVKTLMSFLKGGGRKQKKRIIEIEVNETKIIGISTTTDLIFDKM